jgi:hypothetical protein
MKLTVTVSQQAADIEEQMILVTERLNSEYA